MCRPFRRICDDLALSDSTVRIKLTNFHVTELEMSLLSVFLQCGNQVSRPRRRTRALVQASSMSREHRTAPATGSHHKSVNVYLIDVMFRVSTSSSQQQTHRDDCPFASTYLAG